MTISTLAVIPVIIGPLQVLIAILPALLLSLGGVIVGMFRPSAMWTMLKLLWRQKVALVVIAGIAAGAVYLVRTFCPGSRATSGQVAGSDWPMFRGGLERRGANDGAAPPTTGGINWRYVADVRTFYASPALIGNRIYITSADVKVMGGSGAIYCIDADTGQLVWKQAPDDYEPTFSSPSIAGNYLVCGEGLHETKKARIVCLDVSAKGKILWTYATRSHVESTPCIDQDRVYVGAGDDGYYCFRLQPGADGQAQVVWHAPNELYPDAETSPAVHNGRMYAGLGIGGKAVVCLDAGTGAQIWRVDTPYPVFGPPTVVNGSVIVGMGNGDFINAAEEVKRREIEKLRKAGKSEEEIAAAEKTLGPAGEIWSLDEKTGAQQWTFKVADTVLGAIAAGTGRLYFGSRDGFVYCLSQSGTLVAKWNAHAPLLTSPVLAGGHVYVVTETGTLFGLLADGLEPVWEARLGFTGPFLSSPAVGRGHVYVGSQQDGLLCLGHPAGGTQLQAVRWDGYAGGPGRGGNIDAQPLPEKGKLGWRFPDTDATEQASALQVTAPPAGLNGALYVPADGERKGLLCVQETTDKSNVRPVELWFAATSNGVKQSPAATTNMVFFVDGQRGDADRNLHCLQTGDGRERWKLAVAADASGEFVLTDEGGLIAAEADSLTAFDTAGRVRWRTACGEVCGVAAASDSLAVVAAEQPPALLVLDLPTGRVLWRRALDAAPAVGPLVRKQLIFTATPDGVAALKLADGERVWEAPGGKPGAPLVLTKDRLAYTTAAGQLVVISISDGRVEQTIEEVMPGMPPLAAPEVFVYIGRTGLMALPASGGTAHSWMNSAWLGQPTCAPVMANSRIYMATDKKGLVCLKSK